MSGVSGRYIRIPGHHKLLVHTAMHMRKQPARPEFKRRVAEGCEIKQQLQCDHFTSAELKQHLRIFRNSNKPSDDGKAQRVNRPERPKNWQQSPRQVKQLCVVQNIQLDADAAVLDTVLCRVSLRVCQQVSQVWSLGSLLADRFNRYGTCIWLCACSVGQD